MKHHHTTASRRGASPLPATPSSTRECSVWQVCWRLPVTRVCRLVGGSVYMPFMAGLSEVACHWSVQVEPDCLAQRRHSTSHGEQERVVANLEAPMHRARRPLRGAPSGCCRPSRRQEQVSSWAISDGRVTHWERAARRLEVLVSNLTAVAQECDDPTNRTRF